PVPGLDQTLVSDLDATGFHEETGNGRLTPVPLSNITIALDASHTLWMSTDKQGDAPPFVIGYRPGTDWVYNLRQVDGVPTGDAVDDFAFTDDGELVVLVGSRLAKGRVILPSGTSFSDVLLYSGFVLSCCVAVIVVFRRITLAPSMRPRLAPLRDLPLN